MRSPFVATFGYLPGRQRQLVSTLWAGTFLVHSMSIHGRMLVATMAALLRSLPANLHTCVHVHALLLAACFLH